MIAAIERKLRDLERSLATARAVLVDAEGQATTLAAARLLVGLDDLGGRLDALLDEFGEQFTPPSDLGLEDASR